MLRAAMEKLVILGCQSARLFQVKERSDVVNASRPQSLDGFPFWAGTRLLQRTTPPATIARCRDWQAGARSRACTQACLCTWVCLCVQVCLHMRLQRRMGEGRQGMSPDPRGIRMPAQKRTPSSILLAWLLRESAEQGQDMSHGDTRSPTHVCAASCKSRVVRGGPQRVPSTSVFHSQSSSNW